MELSQRTGQLFYLLLGEGYPVGDHPNVVQVKCQEHFGARYKAQGARKDGKLLSVVSCPWGGEDRA